MYEDCYLCLFIMDISTRNRQAYRIFKGIQDIYLKILAFGIFCCTDYLSSKRYLKNHLNIEIQTKKSFFS